LTGLDARVGFFTS